jgi:hypothetical protein
MILLSEFRIEDGVQLSSLEKEGFGFTQVLQLLTQGLSTDDAHPHLSSISHWQDLYVPKSISL